MKNVQNRGLDPILNNTTNRQMGRVPKYDTSLNPKLEVEKMKNDLLGLCSKRDGFGVKEVDFYYCYYHGYSILKVLLISLIRYITRISRIAVR